MVELPACEYVNKFGWYMCMISRKQTLQ